MEEEEKEEKEEDKQGKNEIYWFNKIIQFASLGLGLKLYDKKLINMEICCSFCTKFHEETL